MSHSIHIIQAEGPLCVAPLSLESSYRPHSSQRKATQLYEIAGSYSRGIQDCCSTSEPHRRRRFVERTGILPRRLHCPRDPHCDAVLDLCGWHRYGFPNIIRELSASLERVTPRIELYRKELQNTTASSLAGCLGIDRAVVQVSIDAFDQSSPCLEVPSFEIKRL